MEEFLVPAGAEDYVHPGGLGGSRDGGNVAPESATGDVNECSAAESGEVGDLGYGVGLAGEDVVVHDWQHSAGEMKVGKLQRCEPGVELGRGGVGVGPVVLAEVEVEVLVHECEAEIVRLDGACYCHSFSGHGGHGALREIKGVGL